MILFFIYLAGVLVFFVFLLTINLDSIRDDADWTYFTALCFAPIFIALTWPLWCIAAIMFELHTWIVSKNG